MGRGEMGEGRFGGTEEKACCVVDEGHVEEVEKGDARE